MVYYNPYITGEYNPPIYPKQPGFFSETPAVHEQIWRRTFLPSPPTRWGLCYGLGIARSTHVSQRFDGSTLGTFIEKTHDPVWTMGLLELLQALIQPKDPRNKSLNFIFPTKYVILKSLSRLAIG